MPDGYDGHNFERLKAHILPRSVAETFSVAKDEWRLVRVEISDDFDHCPCGKEIKEHCFIKNQKNGITTFVGNVCIKRFMGIDTGNLFEGLKRIAKDPNANANSDVIRYAHDRGFLYDEKEYNFLLQISRKRKLSAAQVAWKQKIIRRILKQIVVQRRSST